MVLMRRVCMARWRAVACSSSGVGGWRGAERTHAPRFQNFRHRSFALATVCFLTMPWPMSQNNTSQAKPLNRKNRNPATPMV